jgi:thiol-disulfide isomerase/thioredoxin
MTRQATTDPLVADLSLALRRYEARRRRRSTRVALLGAALVVVTSALGATYTQLVRTAPPFRALKPPLTLTALSGRDPFTGEHIGASMFTGKAGFIVVWQSYCPPCLPELTAVNEFTRDHPDVPVLGLDVDDLPAAAIANLKHAHIKVAFPTIESRHVALTHYGLAGYPTILAVDRHGRVVAAAVGGATSHADLPHELQTLRQPTKP